MAMDHHRWDLARNSGTNPNGFGPHGDNSVPDAGLPRASGGQKPSAEHVNRNAQGITDSKLRASDSHLINRTGRGVTLTSHPTPSNTPFGLVGVGKGYVCMKMGSLMYLENYMKFDVRQNFSGFKPATEDEALMNRGGEFLIDIKNGDNAACYGTDGQLVSKSGDRYASYLFFGIQGGTPIDGVGDIDDDYLLYFDFFLGFPTPTLRYKKVSLAPTTGIIPVAYVFKSRFIMQVLKDNMFVSNSFRNFQVSFYKKDTTSDEWRFKVSPGVINNRQPKYSSGKLLGDPDGYGECPSGNSLFVYLKCGVSSAPPYSFPEENKCTVICSDKFEDDTSSYAYFLLAAAEFTTVSGKRVLSVQGQYVETSLRGEAYNYMGTKPYYYVYRT